MRVNDIPESMMKDIRAVFEATPDVRKLRTQQQMLQRSGRFREALDVAQKLDGLFSVVVDQYMKQTEEEVMTIDTETADIPQKDKDAMMEKIMVLFMACDIVDTAVMDLNDILHRSHPDIDITTFNDIKQISAMARKKLQYLQEKGDYMQDLIWADKCDNMYEVIQSKARSIIRKKKEDLNWGRNMLSI